MCMLDYSFYKFYARGKSQEYVLDKRKSIASYKGYMINRLMKMFHYENLPDTIPQYMLEFYLLVNGTCLITKYHDKPYAFIGSFGGEPDPYFRPTQYIVANPALKLNKTYDLWDTKGEEGDKCVLMRNDYMWMGLNPLMSRYAVLLAENVITMRTADIMLRVVAMLTSPDDKTKAAAEKYLHDLEDGKLGVVGENRFFEGVKLQSPPSNNGSYLTQFIELQQYYKGSFFNEIGLSASFNMKREAIGEGEATLNEDTLAPLIDTMLQCRQEDVSRLNEIFDLNISVEFDSAWQQNIEETKLQLEVLSNEANPISQLNGTNSEDANGDRVSQLIDSNEDSQLGSTVSQLNNSNSSNSKGSNEDTVSQLNNSNSSNSRDSNEDSVSQINVLDSTNSSDSNKGGVSQLNESISGGDNKENFGETDSGRESKGVGGDENDSSSSPESSEGYSTGASSSNSSEQGNERVNEDSNSTDSSKVSQLTTVNINLQSVNNDAQSKSDSCESSTLEGSEIILKINTDSDKVEEGDNNESGVSERTDED